MLVNEALMDPLGGMTLLARSVAIAQQPLVDHRPIRASFGAGLPTGVRFAATNGDANAARTARR